MPTSPDAIIIILILILIIIAFISTAIIENNYQWLQSYSPLDNVHGLIVK